MANVSIAKSVTLAGGTESPGAALSPQALNWLYGELRESGFEVVGVNFDFSEEAALRAIEEHSLPWQEVKIVPDPSVMDLWTDASDLRALPRAYLIDRAGVLRWESVGVDVEELERQVHALVAPAGSF